jgi:hypothetical protein
MKNIYSAKNLDYGHHNTVIGSYSMSNIGLASLAGATNGTIFNAPTNSTINVAQRDDITNSNRNSSSSYNTVIGYNTMNSQYIQSSSVSNTVIGANAFSNFISTTTPTYNVYRQNTFLGFNAQPISGVYSNQIVLGTSTETTYIPGMLTVSNDVSFNSRLAVLLDVSLNRRLFVGGDVSLNQRLVVQGDVSMNGRLSVLSDVSFNKRKDE